MISALPHPGIHGPAAIVVVVAIGEQVRYSVPVMGRKVRQETLAELAGCVFEPRCRTTEVVEPRQRGIEIGLVKNFVSVHAVIVDRLK